MEKSREQLIDELKKFRLEKSQEEGIAPFMVFHNTTLDEIVDKRPKNINDFYRISGFGKVKTEKYGKAILEILSINPLYDIGQGVKNEAKIIFIDSEIDKQGKVLDLGAVKNGREFHSKVKESFVDFLKGSEFAVGHNIIDHDLVHLEKEIKESGISKFIDTLYLSPLLFAKKPYHKLLKDDKFDPNEYNNPLNDSMKARDLFYDEVAKFERLDEHLKIIYFNLLNESKYFKDFFDYMVFTEKVSSIADFIKNQFVGKICDKANVHAVVTKYPEELAFAISQIAVMMEDSTSITPPWILRRFPKVENILQMIKGKSCADCEYCRSNLDVIRGLQKWFGYKEFRTYDGENLQEQAAKCAIDGESLLAVFPTGGGKSITFQLPALMQGENQKGLTMVISPLQSLQKDQIDNLEDKHGITKAVRLDSSLDPIERTQQIDRVEAGGASMLYISPESLRSKSIHRLLVKRNVVRFVIDEAHCFSAWGQDFRTDYLYIAEFIKNLQNAKGNNHRIPVSCFTATAKDEVVKDIIKYFKDNLDLDLKKVVSSATRKNLAYHAIHVQDETEKDIKLRNLLQEFECPTIIYVSRIARATSLANKLIKDGFEAIAYHGKMDKCDRVQNQELFTKGKCNIIVATKAFGMGVDKDNVGLVIHYDISTSLEDYVQEAGRAGRDSRLNAVCYALFNDDDINKHFAFLSQTKITQAEIAQIWRAVKRLTNKREEITASQLDIAREAGWSDEKEDEIKTRVTTSINALEQVHYLKRGQNMPKVYANSILVKSTIEASEKIRASNAFESDKQKEEAVRVISRLFKTRAKGGRDADGNNEHIDFIADRESLEPERVIRIIQILREEEILADTKDLFGFLQKDQGRNAERVLEIFEQTEKFLCDFLEENKEGITVGQKFNIKEMNVQMQEFYPNTSIASFNKVFNFYDIKRIVKRRNEENRDYINFKCYLSVDEIKEKSDKRLDIAAFIVKYLYNKLPKSVKDDGNTKVEFSVLELMQSYNFENQMFNVDADAIEIEDALYYLKRIGSLDIDGGFLVIYNRMTIKRLEEDTKSQYTKDHYEKLDKYYDNKKEQIHIIGEYLKLLSTDYEQALTFTYDYFTMDYDMFKYKYFKGRLGELKLNMTQTKYNQIFKGLSQTQREVVNDSKTKYITVIAGPGSGKTMLLTHKLAAIYMQEDIKHEQILMLTFSRAAATEFKMRLLKLIGNAANFIKIKTFHSYCFDLLGRVGTLEKSEDIVKDAILKIEAKEVDNFKLTNVIMVIDEAQDMGKKEYALVRALMNSNDGMKVIAVGDDDQNIYEWRGSSSEFLGELSKVDSSAKYELIENFRSAKNVIDFSNNFAVRISNRLKTKPLKAIKQENGQITICKLQNSDIEIPVANAVLKDKPAGSTCIIARSNDQVNNIVGLLTKEGIKARVIQTNTNFRLFDLVEVREFANHVMQGQSATIDVDVWNEVKSKLQRKYMQSSNLENVLKLIRDFETLNARYKYKTDFKQFVDESKLEDFISEQSTIFVSTIHQTKGREFDNVYLALGESKALTDADYRQIYVAITRAKSNLHIFSAVNCFDDIKAEGLIRLEAKMNYGKPNKITLALSHKDVNLGLFDKVQKEIATLRSGNVLQVDKEGLLANGKYVLKFSKAFLEVVEKQESKGYFLDSAIINHIVWWHPKDVSQEEKVERMILLPNIEFVKR
ncbi:MAG: RecQ family ATP-dependent DNA helicase [Rickettsiales bacterium]|jgi:ATP-dependent DNA helicase RecQ|nr:RecQ family ATP-dependent DNA helicase [Rickettsiales bacterium]